MSWSHSTWLGPGHSHQGPHLPSPISPPSFAYPKYLLLSPQGPDTCPPLGLCTHYSLVLPKHQPEVRPLPVTSLRQLSLHLPSSFTHPRPLLPSEARLQLCLMFVLTLLVQVLFRSPRTLRGLTCSVTASETAEIIIYHFVYK